MLAHTIKELIRRAAPKNIVITVTTTHDSHPTVLLSIDGVQTRFISRESQGLDNGRDVFDRLVALVKLYHPDLEYVDLHKPRPHVANDCLYSFTSEYNGGNPFLVCISISGHTKQRRRRTPTPFNIEFPCKVKVYRVPQGEIIPASVSEFDSYKYFTEEILDVSASKIFGVKSSSVLIQCKDSHQSTKDAGSRDYVFIGNEIYGFTGEPINQFWSKMGNNGVPNPVAISKHSVYFIHEKVVGARTDFTPEGDTIGDMDEYYGDSVFGDFYAKEMLTKPIQNIKPIYGRVR
jgi:hypothetical protein